MIVVAAQRGDRFARDLVSRWQAYGAGLLTCTDLSRSGWRYQQGSMADSTAVIDGEVVAMERITGVVTRQSCVYSQELPEIVPEDQEYAAAEMTAFLLTWLSDLHCPVLNRPSPTGLAGPFWRQERWVAVAAQLGIPVSPVRRRASGSPYDASTFCGESPSHDHCTSITVVGNRCFGAVNERARSQARALSKAAGLDLLSVCFSLSEQGELFLHANTLPDITQEQEIEDAVLR